jgi:hypothetical protein
MGWSCVARLLRATGRDTSARGTEAGTTGFPLTVMETPAGRSRGAAEVKAAKAREATREIVVVKECIVKGLWGIC